MRASSYTPWLKPVPARHRALPPTPGTVSHSLARRREPSHPYGRRPPVTTNADLPADLAHHRLEQQTATPRTPRPASTTSTTHKTCAIPHRPSRRPKDIRTSTASAGERSQAGRISDPGAAWVGYPTHRVGIPTRLVGIPTHIQLLTCKNAALSFLFLLTLLSPAPPSPCNPPQAHPRGLKAMVDPDRCTSAVGARPARPPPSVHRRPAAQAPQPLDDFPARGQLELITQFAGPRMWANLAVRRCTCSRTSTRPSTSGNWPEPDPQESQQTVRTDLPIHEANKPTGRREVMLDNEPGETQLPEAPNRQGGPRHHPIRGRVNEILGEAIDATFGIGQFDGAEGPLQRPGPRQSVPLFSFGMNAALSSPLMLPSCRGYDFPTTDSLAA